MRSRLGFRGAAGLLSLWAPALLGACTVRPPLHQAETLQHLEHRLLAEEAEVYLPEETDQLRAQIRSTLRVENFLPDQRLLSNPADLRERIETQVWEAYALLDELASLRSRLQQEQQTALGFLASHLVEHRSYRDYPELSALALEIEEKLSQTVDFGRPGAYRHNLELMLEIGELFSQLRQSWLRYNGGPLSSDEIKHELTAYREEIQALQPADKFIVIDTAINRLFVRQGQRILLDAACSTGSGHRLATSDREWDFQTPRGEFVVRQKLEDPVWWKPDWAFIEAGEPVPTRKRDRLEYGALGDYALAFGEGYFIHGTVYTRLLGQPVTHGCVRVGESELATLIEMVPVGARIFIF